MLERQELVNLLSALFGLEKDASELMVDGIESRKKTRSLELPRGLGRIDFLAPIPQKKITKRENEIIKLLAEGKSDEEIAEILVISARTVIKHRQNICKKIGLTTQDIKVMQAEAKRRCS